MLKIYLTRPEIPQNSGNVARLAAATGAELYLVGDIGFELSEKQFRRAGMDYLTQTVINRIPDIDDFYKLIDNSFYFISTKGKKCYSEIPYSDNLSLVFGNESSGLPAIIYEKYQQQLYRVPMKSDVRSINLASTASLVVYSVLEKGSFKGLL